MNIATWLYQTALVRPDAPAIRLGNNLCATYGDFARSAARIGVFLRDHHGIGPGDRISIFARNAPEYLELLYGVLWIGATVVPVNHKLHSKEAAWIIANAEARIVFTESGTVFSSDTNLPTNTREVSIGSVPPNEPSAPVNPPASVNDDDTAWLFYTSGTTGRPKGVMITHRNLRVMAMTYPLDVDQIFPSDHPLYAAPMSHGAGLYNFHYVRIGACHVIPPSQGFDAAEIASLAKSLGNITFFAAPTMIKRLIAHAQRTNYNGDGIRTIIYGGGPMYLADIDHALDVFGPRFAQIYGQGECPMTITAMNRDLVADTTHPEAMQRRASVGLAQACVEIRIADEDLNDLPTGEVGEVLVRGDTVMAGYWRNPEATSATLVDGWLRTGDLGRLDGDGFLTLTDRSKDVIISGGTNIYPREVEEALLTHKDVYEIAVIGASHADWGEEVVAFVVPLEGTKPDAEALTDWCKTQIASFKKPSRYVFVPDLPKNGYGKILKTQLRAQLSEQS
ncbi:MAG: class I adenylate-forming enzyme family protein [Heliomarina sp.]|uniref:class I adenylate-forming enzyme family protein n=1 Tax=Heliomarina sp. TaxID=2917556 RepID=UPI0040596CD6